MSASDPTLVLRSVTVEGRPTSVRVHDGRIAAIDLAVTPERGDLVIEGAGGALLPGLHDHHLHLAAMAAADRSLSVAGADLDATVRAEHQRRPPGEWLRVVGYDEAHDHGHPQPLDRSRLDAAAPGRAVRVQHRSGAMWVLSSTGLAQLDLSGDLPGVDRDPHGIPTGRLFRLDGWLREHLPAESAPDIAAVTRRLARKGVTGVTDATPTSQMGDLELLADPDLAVHVTAMGGPALATARFPPPLGQGPVKVIVGDDELPHLDGLIETFAAAHEAGRSVAVHCVTRVALALALAAWDGAGAVPGDRVEHGAVVPPELRARVAAFGLTVVTQPGFVAARGDRYLRDVEPDDVAHLYPCASLLGSGVEVGGSTDAPFGPEDPWLAMRTAADRRTAAGTVLGPDERIDPARALDLFLSAPERPGGPPRRVMVGAAADLCLLDRDLDAALDDPRADHVSATVCAGRVTFLRP